jgi:hypothetical protein
LQQHSARHRQEGSVGFARIETRILILSIWLLLEVAAAVLVVVPLVEVVREDTEVLLLVKHLVAEPQQKARCPLVPEPTQ